METSNYRIRLEEEKKNLEEQLATVARRNPSNPGDWEAIPQEVGQEADPNDRADLLEHLAENNAILIDLELRYADVNKALARIEAGSYGVCEISGENIEEERLDADPAARTCKAHLAS